MPDGAFVIRDGDGDPVTFVNPEDYYDLYVESSYPWIVPAGSLVLKGHVTQLGL